jgi:hypothetical protein
MLEPVTNRERLVAKMRSNGRRDRSSSVYLLGLGLSNHRADHCHTGSGGN